MKELRFDDRDVSQVPASLELRTSANHPDLVLTLCWLEGAERFPTTVLLTRKTARRLKQRLETWLASPKPARKAGHK